MGKACEHCKEHESESGPKQQQHLREDIIYDGSGSIKLRASTTWRGEPRNDQLGRKRATRKLEKKLTRVVEAGLELGLVEGPVGLRHLHLRHVDTGPQQAVRLQAVGLREARTKAGGARAHPRRTAHRVGNHASWNARPCLALAPS